MRDNTVEYVRGVRESFSERSVTDADLLVFSALAYMEFERCADFCVPDASIELGKLAEHVPLEKLTEHDCNPDGMLELLQAIVENERFAAIPLQRFASDVDAKRAVQFAACCFPVTADFVVVAYRGTDAKFTGWHEDFNMMWQPATPGQEDALSYLEAAVQAYPSARFVLCGHSKGGSFAEFAALFSPADLEARVTRAVSFDGPALTRLGSAACPEYLEYDSLLLERYGQVAFPVVRYVFPSKIGLMLEARDPARFLYTESVDPQLNHNVCSVRIIDGQVVTIDPLPADLNSIESNNTWVRSLSLEERRFAANATIDALSRADLMIGFGDDTPQNLLKALLEEYRRHSRAERRMARGVLAKLVSAQALG